MCHSTADRTPDLVDGVIFTYSDIKAINFCNDSNDVTAQEFLEKLFIPNNSILNVDYQYHLWDILKNGPEYTQYI